MRRSILLLPFLVLSAAIEARAQACDGCIPLNDLGPGLYLDRFEGGLYPGGQNEPPPAHRQAALAEAAQVLPRDAGGAPSAQGVVGMISVTMSNANQEFSAYERLADPDLLRNARVAIVNLAQGGQALDRIANPNVAYWDHLDQRLEAAGLAPPQVQVAWLKMAAASPTTDFPQHAHDLVADATDVLQILRARFPHLRLAFFSSRTYGGYSDDPLRSEPLSYETGFATKWLVEAQIGGDPELNYDPDAGPVVAPLVLWGPYLWANGSIPRSDGLVWLPEDVEGDGVHPSPQGEAKVAALLARFFETDFACVPWFDLPTGARTLVLEATADAHVNEAQPGANYGGETFLHVEDAPERNAFLRFELPPIEGEIQRAKLSLLLPSNGSADPGAELRGVSDASWLEHAITYANAPPIDGELHGLMPLLSRGTAISFDVTSALPAGEGSPGGAVSFALVMADAATGQLRALSREGGAAPRLVLTVRPSCADPGVPYCHALANSTGGPATLALTGSASLAANDLAVHASGLPPSQPGLFFYGLAPGHAPFGDGLRCVDLPIARLLPPLDADGLGQLSRALDFTAPPFASGPLSIEPGDAFHLQLWYRDPPGGPSHFNLSTAQQVRTCP